MDSRYDVVVVGSGPSGSAAAQACAKYGLNTLLIEEQAHIGYPMQCAGLLSRSAFTECHVSDRSVLNTVSGARITAGSSRLSFSAGETKAFVVDRAMLDQEMAFHAAEQGAEIRVKTRAVEVSPQKHTIIIQESGSKKEISYNVLIAADGPRSTIARQCGLARAPMYLSGLQADVLYETDPDSVNIFPNASPDFFGWIIPMSEDRARIGLCGLSDVKGRFERFIRQFPQKSIQFTSGTIPLGTLEKTYAEGIMIVGDAAAFAKPTSGGGVYTGIRSARHAAEIARNACESGIYHPEYLARYQKAWQNDFGIELKAGMQMLKVRQQISPSQMEKLVQIMSHPQVRDLIVRKGDMDRPLSLILSLLMNPRMVAATRILLPSFIKSLKEIKAFL